MTDWSDYYSGQRVDSFARFVALRHHDVRVGGSIPGLGSFNTVTHSLIHSFIYSFIHLFIHSFGHPKMFFTARFSGVNAMHFV